MADLSSRCSTPQFASAANEAAFNAAYDAVLGKWPVSVESVKVPSAYGTTHVQVTGPQEGKPLVLLHGGGATSTVWFANVGALSRTHRVYAVDQMGDAGRSVHDGQPIKRPADLMSWLDALLDGLGLDGAALVGHSYGGWLALSYALHAPARVRKLVLLDPTYCFTGMTLGFRVRALPLFIRPSAQRTRNFLTWEAAGTTLDTDWLVLASLAGGEVRRSKLILPRRPRDSDLLRAAMPTLVLTAEKSRQHDIGRLAANAERLMSNVFTAVVPGASHFTMPMHAPEHLNRELTQFLV